MEPLATEPLVVLASASPIVGELLGENRISVRHSATGYASGPRRTAAPHTGIDRHPRSLTDPWSAASADETLELRASRGPITCVQSTSSSTRPPTGAS